MELVYNDGFFNILSAKHSEADNLVASPTLATSDKSNWSHHIGHLTSDIRLTLFLYTID